MIHASLFSSSQTLLLWLLKASLKLPAFITAKERTLIG